MTFSNVCFCMAMIQISVVILLGIRTYFGPLPHILAKIGVGFYIFFLVSFQVSIVSCLLFKNLQLLKPQMRLTLDDEFWYAFVCLVTISVSLVQGAHLVWYGEGISLYYILIGESSLLHFSFSEYFGSRFVNFNVTDLRSQYVSFFYRIGGLILIFLMISNGLIHILLRIGKLKKEAENEVGQFQFNNVSKNPGIIKDFVVVLTVFANMAVFNLAKNIISQAPQSFDISLSATLVSNALFGVLTPLIFWFSNSKLRTFMSREFLEEAPIWVIELKKTIDSKIKPELDQEVTIEMSEI